MSLILTIFVFMGLNGVYERLRSCIGVEQTEILEEANAETVIKANEKPEGNIITADEEIENMLDATELINDIWQIEIPEIHLIAPIAEGTTQEVMREYVGHFEETNLWIGNVGLAAHNRRISNKLF